MINDTSAFEATVLVVEDEPLIRAQLSQILQDEGFLPHCVQWDIEAYTALKTHTELTGLITDINLGFGTTGFDVARFARTLHPDLSVIYMSGDAEEEQLCAFGVPGSRFIAKPFTEPQMVELIQGMRGPDVAAAEPRP